ncbi:isochorismatase family protein [Cupriavidus necator]|uniref:isochorismatase family protein n=1 Tax=Cupriavidus necator TaxID=106590 RepID=UPI001F27592F|nr:isochorismatase family protein [Cupriavidus necator]
MLALHYQNDVLHADGRIRVGIDDDASRAALVDSAARLLAAARRSQWPIMHVRIAFRPDYGDLPRNIPIFRRTEAIGAVKDGEWGAEFYAPLSPLLPLDSPREFVLKHTSISAFRGTQLDQLLRQHGVGRVVVAGVATHSVVEGTVREAAELGYEVVVVADACAAAQRATHEASLASMALMAEVTTLAELAAANEKESS